MTLLKHELRQNKTSLIIWSAIISFMLAICVIIYPEMATQMGDISKMFADMGSFSSAFGMDQINFGEFTGYFGIECGNVLGLGGAFFASILGISALSKEEDGHTAEFLLVHPISRKQIITEKLCAVYIQLIIMNVVVIGCTTLSIVAIGEEIDVKVIALMFLAYFILQVEMASITFGISAFLKNNGIGIGLGLATMMYFLNIISNLTEEAQPLKYITPFGYTDSAEIINNVSLETNYLVVGIAFALLGVVAAYWQYNRKDIS
jgi:ABC-2 type transport system permease protein